MVTRSELGCARALAGSVLGAAAALAGTAVAEPAAIAHVPFLPYLTQAREPALCRDVIVAEQTRFLGSAIAAAWTGSIDPTGAGARLAAVPWDAVDMIRPDVQRNHTYTFFAAAGIGAHGGLFQLEGPRTAGANYRLFAFRDTATLGAAIDDVAHRRAAELAQWPHGVEGLAPVADWTTTPWELVDRNDVVALRRFTPGDPAQRYRIYTRGADGTLNEACRWQRWPVAAAAAVAPDVDSPYAGRLAAPPAASRRALADALAPLLATLGSIVGDTRCRNRATPPPRSAKTAPGVPAAVLWQPWQPAGTHTLEEVLWFLRPWGAIEVWNRARVRDLEAQLAPARTALAGWAAAAFGAGPDAAGVLAGQALQGLIGSFLPGPFTLGGHSRDFDSLRADVRAFVAEAHADNLSSRIDGGEPFAFRATSQLREALVLGMEDAAVDALIALGAAIGRQTSPNLDPALAAAVEHPRLVRLLLARGAAVDEPNAFAKTALMYAAQHDAVASLRILIAAGADPAAATTTLYDPHYFVEPYYVDCRDIREGGRTALHYAAAGGSPAAIELLLGAGATADARTSRGRTPGDLLAENCRLDAAARTRAHRALASAPQ